MSGRAPDPRAPSQARPDAGYSLIEVLATLFIVALLSAAGYGVLNNALTAQEVLGAREERLRDIQIARAILREDMTQLARPRPVRDAYGDAEPMVFFGGVIADDQPILTFLRTGWANPAGIERRGPLQRVSYRIEDGVLMRQVWLRPDAQPDTPVTDQALLSGVEEVRLRFTGPDWSRGPVWVEEWRMGMGLRAVRSEDRLPRLMELEMELEDYGPISHVFTLPDLALAPEPPSS